MKQLFLLIPALALGSAHATSFDDGDVITSGADSSQSMVAGSSPTSLGTFDQSKFTTTRTTSASTVEDSSQGTDVSGVTATLYNPRTGKVLAKQRYGASTEGKRLSLNALRSKVPVLSANGTGGTSSSQGCIKVTVWQKRHTLLGFFAAKWSIWTDWCWKNSIQQVYVNRTGNGHDQASGYSFDGAGPAHRYYYDWGVDNGYPHSAYHYDQEGAFSSPGCCGAQGHWYPKNTLDSYRDGTWAWYTSS